MDDLPDLFYINLRHRADRRAQLLAELDRIGYPAAKVHRIEAERRQNGALGCGLSHIRALEEVRRRGLQRAIILEDDFMWRHRPERTLDTLRGALAQEWDVCLLACSGEVVPGGRTPHVDMVADCRTTSGYMVRADSVAPLLAVFRDTVDMPTNVDTPEAALRREHHIDQQWRHLQGADPGWVVTDPVLGRQRSGHSDITHAHQQHPSD
jgi:glycosyl transferase, family 25